MEGTPLLIERMEYGQLRLYPSKHSPMAQTMAEIQRKRTFDANDIKRWQQLGYVFHIAKLPR